jgi:hypothetical protein
MSAVGMWALSTLLTIAAVVVVGAGLVALAGLSVFAALGDPTRALRGGDPAATAALVTTLALLGLGIGVVFAVFYTAAITGITTLVYRALHDELTSVWRAYARGFARVPAVVLTGILFAIAMLVLAVLSIPTFVLGAFGLLGGLIATIALVVWAANPGARKPWLKWLIILATPFGLVMYFSVRWSLWMQAIVIERTGPIDALSRSNFLVAGNWFRVFGTWMVMAIITYLLQAIPGALLSLMALGITTASRDAGPGGAALGWVNLANYAGNLLGNLLCGITQALNPQTVTNTPASQLAPILNALLALSPRTG